MKPKIRYVVVGIVVGLSGTCIATALILLLIWPTNARDNVSSARRTDMANLSIRWGRFAPFPITASDFSIRTEGSPFTRTFIGSFNDSPQVVALWLENSPGIIDGESTVEPDGTTNYKLRTGEGASYGEVIVSPDKSHVSFQVSWS